jgi:hypothetical protein
MSCSFQFPRALRTFKMTYVLRMRTPDGAAIFDLYGRWVVDRGLLEQIQSELGERRRQGIYSLAVVLWLMIWQRLQPRGTLSHAVRHLVQGNGRSLLSNCKRVREGRISAAAGGYCQSVKKMSKLVPQQVTRDIVAQLSKEIGEPWPGVVVMADRNFGVFSVSGYGYFRES